MRQGLLFGADAAVAAWAFATHNYLPMQYNKAVGIIRTDTHEMVGAALFQGYNGNDIGFSYYGRNTLTAGLVRAMAQIAIRDFDVSRATIVTSRKHKNLARWLQRAGFRLEGAMRCYYGRVDAPRNAGLRFVIFRPELARLAGLSRSTQAA